MSTKSKGSLDIKLPRSFHFIKLIYQVLRSVVYNGHVQDGFLPQEAEDVPDLNRQGEKARGHPQEVRRRQKDHVDSKVL